MKNRLNIIINNSGLNQTEFANSIGTTQATISRYLNGSRKIDKTTALLIEKIYKFSSNWLLTGEGEMFIHPPSASGGIPGSGNVNISGNKSGGDFTVKNIGHVTNHLHEYYLNEDESTLIILLRKKKNRKQVIEAIKAMLS